jgi:hypothetical protein
MVPLIKKADLLKVIQKNREAHRRIFLEAVEGYKAEALRMLEERVRMIKSGKVVNITVVLPVPEDHTQDYDRVIKMIEMDTSKTIELQEDEFAQYVMDDWQWKRQWATTNALYTARVQ